MARVPVVEHGVLQADPPIAVGSDAWQHWLVEGKSFAVQGSVGRFSVRRRQGRQDTWQAYRVAGRRRVAVDIKAPSTMDDLLGAGEALERRQPSVGRVSRESDAPARDELVFRTRVAPECIAEVRLHGAITEPAVTRTIELLREHAQLYLHPETAVEQISRD